MRALILFFQRHHLFFLFLILEGIAVLLLFRFNYLQRIAFARATSVVSGNIYEQMSIWTDYLHLKEQNMQLQDENAQLRNMLQGTFYVADTARIAYYDSIKQRRYEHIPAKVINKEVHKQYNYLSIDRGKSVGISEGMAVVGHEGIVGIVYSVSDRFARVMPVINRHFRVSVKFKKNDYFGSLNWDGRSYRHATLNEISLHVPVSIGDTLVISGYSGSFPEGIHVGTVEKIEQKDGSFYTIEVLLATDFRQLHYVTVIDDRMKKELQELEQQTLEMQ